MVSEIEEDAATLIDLAMKDHPFHWRMVLLKDIVIVRGGKRLPKGANFSSEQTRYPYIRVVDLVNTSVRLDEIRYLTAEVYRQISQYRIFKEDVYISIAGTIGLVGTIPEQLDGANLTENAARLIIKDPSQLDKDFLALYLNGDQGQIQVERLTSKTTQPKLALTRIEQIQIPLPPMIEQRAIARALQTVQDSIQTRRKEIELERERKATLMHYLFTHGTRNEPTTQSEIGEIPESWEVSGT